MLNNFFQVFTSALNSLKFFLKNRYVPEFSEQEKYIKFFSEYQQSTIVSEGFKGGFRGAPIMPKDAVSRAANVERNGGHKWFPKYVLRRG